MNVYPLVTNVGFGNNNSVDAKLDLGTSQTYYVKGWSYSLRIGYYGHPSPPGQNAYTTYTMRLDGSNDNTNWTQLDTMTFRPVDVKNYYIDPGSPFHIPTRQLATIANYRYYRLDWSPGGYAIYQQGGNNYDGLMALDFELKTGRMSAPFPADLGR